jgi:hypothetical protein
VHSLFLQAGLLRTRSFVPVRGEVLMASSLNRELGGSAVGERLPASSTSRVFASAVAIALDAPTTTVDYAEFARRLSVRVAASASRALSHSLTPLVFAAGRVAPACAAAHALTWLDPAQHRPATLRVAAAQ